MWFDDRAVQRDSRRSEPPPCCHDRDTPSMLSAMSWNQRSLAPAPDEPCELADRWRSRHPAATAEATTNQYSTNRRPDYRSPTEHVTDDTSAATRPSRHETSYPKRPRTDRTATLELPRRPGSSHFRNRLHPANRMVVPESALYDDLASSGNGHHSPHESLRATGHADVATDMSSPPVDQPHDKTSKLHTHVESGWMPLLSAGGRSNVTNAEKTTPARQSTGRPWRRRGSEQARSSLFRTSCPRPLFRSLDRPGSRLLALRQHGFANGRAGRVRERTLPDRSQPDACPASTSPAWRPP